MNLINVKEKLKETIAFMKYQNEAIASSRNTIQATKFDKVLTSGTPPKKDTSDIVEKIIEMEKDLEIATNEYNRLTSLVNELEEIYKTLNDRDKLIYLEYNCKGMSAIKLGIKYGISDKAIYKILKKVEKKLKVEKSRDY